jgi:hypothetical protein
MIALPGQAGEEILTPFALEASLVSAAPAGRGAVFTAGESYFPFPRRHKIDPASVRVLPAPHFHRHEDPASTAQYAFEKHASSQLEIPTSGLGTCLEARNLDFQSQQMQPERELDCVN